MLLLQKHKDSINSYKFFSLLVYLSNLFKFSKIFKICKIHIPFCVMADSCNTLIDISNISDSSISDEIICLNDSNEVIYLSDSNGEKGVYVTSV